MKRKIIGISIILAAIFVYADAYCQDNLPDQRRENISNQQQEHMEDMKENRALQLEGLKPSEAINEDIKWVWAEVINIDNSNKRLTLKYMNYETNVEGKIDVVVTDKTEFEDGSSFDKLKKGDYTSVDYEVKNGVNEAVFIIVEKYDDIQGDEAGGE